LVTFLNGHTIKNPEILNFKNSDLQYAYDSQYFVRIYLREGHCEEKLLAICFQYNKLRKI